MGRPNSGFVFCPNLYYICNPNVDKCLYKYGQVFIFSMDS